LPKETKDKERTNSKPQTKTFHNLISNLIILQTKNFFKLFLIYREATPLYIKKVLKAEIL